MIKRIILILLLSCISFSCGKKGPPEYKDSEQKTQFQRIFNYKA